MLARLSLGLPFPRPPVKSDAPVRVDVPDNPKVNGGPAFVANALEIDFHKMAFDRATDSPLDPPAEVMSRAITSLLSRLRYGAELDQSPGLIRGRGARSYHLSFAGVDADIWSKVNSLAPDWKPPPWDEILLDANAALPHVGTTVVLGATALEVFIANILDDSRPKARSPLTCGTGSMSEVMSSSTEY